MKSNRILIVGQSSEQHILIEILSEAGFHTFAKQSVAEALLEIDGVDVVIADAEMENARGLFERCWNIDPPPGVIAITDPWTISSALKNLQEIAVTFLKRPFFRDELVRIVQETMRHVDLSRQYARLKQYVDVHGGVQ